MGERGAVILGVRRNGEEFPADAAISKIVIDGKSILTVALRDITEQKQAETEARLLADLGAIFAGALEFEGRLTGLARLLARDLADLCVLDIIGDDGTIRRARVACRDLTREWLCDVLMRTSADGERHRVAAPVLETGQGVLIAKVTPHVIRSWARTYEDRMALQKAGFQSAIGVPLMAREKVLGTVSLLSLSRVYGPGDLHVAEVVAQRASVLLDNARLFDTAKRAIKARDDILGIVAHDLRNPLAAISALGTVLRLRDTKREIGEEIGEEIGNAVNRMNRLIQDLLDVTGIEAGHLSLRLARLDAAKVATDSVVPQTPLVASASLELRLDMAPNLPDIWADHDRLLQVFDNLIGNAIKFTKPHGQITLAAAAHAGEVLFSVADTGRGIATAHLPYVFDRFWQGSRDKRRGAGLGLAIVKGIVEAHGGRIWVQSTPGHGSTFFFTIPTATSQAASAARREGAPQPS
jgi:signal transduction histidine kinase